MASEPPDPLPSAHSLTGDSFVSYLMDTGQADAAAYLCDAIYGEAALKSIVGPATSLSIEVDSFRAWVLGLGAKGNATIQMIFRGTVVDPANPVDTINNIMTDADARLEDLRQPAFTSINQNELHPAKVHRGFQQGFLQLWEEIEHLPGMGDVLKQLQSGAASEMRIQTMGHSLGAALATLAAVRLRQLGAMRVEVITFGCPRVGNSGFKGLYEKLQLGATSARFTNLLDLVPKVPLEVEMDDDVSEKGVVQQAMGLWRRVSGVGCKSRPTAHAASDSYCHACEDYTVDKGFVALLSKACTFVSEAYTALQKKGEPASATNALSQTAELSRNALSQIGEQHSMKLYVKNLKIAKSSIEAFARYILFPMLQNSDRSGADVISSGANAASNIQACMQVALKGSQAISALPVAAAAVSASASLFGSYLVYRKMDQLSIQISGEIQQLATVTQQVRQDVMGVKHELVLLSKHIDERFDMVQHEMVSLRKQINERFEMLQDTVRNEAEKVFVENIMLEVSAISNTLQDHIVQYISRVETGTAMADNAISWHLENLKVQAGKLLLKTRAKLALSGGHRSGTIEHLSILMSTVISSFWHCILVQRIIAADTASCSAPTTFPQIAEAVGFLYFIGFASPMDGWMKHLHDEWRAFLHSVVGSAIFTEQGLHDLRIGLEGQQPLEKAYSLLALEPTSTTLRRKIFEEAARIRKPIEEAPTALNILNILAQADGSLEGIALFDAGLAWALQVPGHEQAVDQSIDLFEKYVAQGGNMRKSLKGVSGFRTLIDWELIFGQVCQKRSVKLAVQLCLAGVSSKEGMEWIKQNADFSDLLDGDTDMPMEYDALRKSILDREVHMSLAWLHRFSDNCSSLVETATLSQALGSQIAAIRSSLDSSLKSLQEEKDYILVAGGVSAGKTTLINAFVSTMLDVHLWNKLKQDDSDQRHLMPTHYDENTSIVTEIEFFKPTKVDGKDLMEILRLEGEMGHDMAVTEKTICEDLLSVQQCIKEWCERRLEEGLIRRLLIRLPSDRVENHPLSIIDTPGMESAGVLDQIFPMINAKAFLLVWVAACDAPQKLGQQGTNLLEWYHAMRSPIPPLLVVTRWDRLMVLPEFKKPKIRSKYIQNKMSDLQHMLQSEITTSVRVAVSTEEMRLRILQALEIKIDSSAGLDDSGWTLKHALIMERHVVKIGARVVGGREALTNISQKVPFEIEFSMSQLVRPTLAVTNAPCALEVDPEDPKDRVLAVRDIRELWLDRMLPQLGSHSATLRICKCLDLLYKATQKIINVVCKSDHKTASSDYMAELRQISQSCTERLQLDLKAYFKHIPVGYHEDFEWKGHNQEDLDKMPEYRRPLTIYEPCSKLGAQDATSHIVPDLRMLYQKLSSSKKPNHELVFDMAQTCWEMWKEKSSANLAFLQREASMELFHAMRRISIDRGAPNLFLSEVQHCRLGSNWIVESELAQLAGAAIGLLGGSVGFLLGGAPGLAFLGFFGGQLLVMNASHARRVRNDVFAANALPRTTYLTMTHRKMYTEEEAVEVAALSILKHISNFFEKASNEVVLAFHKQEMEACLKEVEEHRFAGDSDCKELRDAAEFQNRMAKIYEMVQMCFTDDMNRRIGSNPWLVSPPKTLKSDLPDL